MNRGTAGSVALSELRDKEPTLSPLADDQGRIRRSLVNHRRLEMLAALKSKLNGLHSWPYETRWSL